MLKIKNIPEGSQAELPKQYSKCIIAQDKYIGSQLKAWKTSIWEHCEEVQLILPTWHPCSTELAPPWTKISENKVIAWAFTSHPRNSRSTPASTRHSTHRIFPFQTLSHEESKNHGKSESGWGVSRRRKGLDSSQIIITVVLTWRIIINNIYYMLSVSQTLLNALHF